ncbi:latent-transforming growth factor beta-binding protein 1 isoform X2 [Denticeps clupeoides]|uniref:latent-transforming growth factor beta-binding protein 1 isoform X2 n=1 Tax=Denticeps clupeoides TaxID=299321 RepID=UPI0010A4CF8D|nr:latent-transforming growth factor beta-binding protein 1 isoform X2 [Denticeps clupeoides]
MDMARLGWNFLLPALLLFSPVPVASDQGGFRRLYVLQPGPGGSDRVRVSSISSAQPHAYSLELTAGFGGQVRTRRTGGQASPNLPSLPVRQEAPFARPAGVNVCGGQCCHGWSVAPGSQRCTRPNCLPQCQNGGMCLRPQHCVCKPGSKGKTCEQKTLPGSSSPAMPGNGHTNGRTAVHTVLPQRPIPQQAFPQAHVPAPLPGSSMSQMTLTMKQSPQLIRPQPFQQQVLQPVSMTVQQAQSQKFVLKPKFYPTQMHRVGPQPDRPIPLSVGHSPLHVGNHTGRIKVVFTPTICKVTCTGGRCHNNCEKGNTTTIISENGHATDTLTAPNFRVVVCHLPCINGGKCSARDKCQCPPNFTGKFCQMAVQNGNHRQQTSVSQVHSTHTLPLTFSNGQNQVQFSPNFVNIHVKHPPEASVQIHQVSQLDSSGQKVQGSHSGHYTTHHTSESSQKTGQSVIYPNQQTYIYYQQPVTSKSQLGRCFQETTGTPCGKAFPGLSKQEDCCGTVGTSWGFHKCQKCPAKPSIPLMGTRDQTECPQGYKKVDNSCQDINECLIQGVCPNGDCMNTHGSYRCICRPGFMPDSSLTGCIPNTPAPPEEKGSCFRLVGMGKQCLHPVSTQLSKQLCCCSVGKAWGPRCDKCPLPGTAAFKEICPGGMGYHVTGPIKPKPINRPTYQEPVLPPLPLPTAHRPVEALSVTERQLPDLPEVVEKTSPPMPVEILPSSAGQGIAPTQLAEVDECQLSPEICGPGVCYNQEEGYTCVCDDGYQLDREQATCVDVDECAKRPLPCSGGRCRNTLGSFRCVCQHGFQTDKEGTSCVDVNECLNPGVCSDGGFCVNTQGSFTCRYCQPGFKMSQSGECEDIDECLDRTVCPSALCSNTPGSYACEPCPLGFQGRDGQCLDVDECQDEQVCTRGHCQNAEGSFACVCDAGFKTSSDGQDCDDVDECEEVAAPCDALATCVNNMGSYACNCPEGFQQVEGIRCEDIDECDDPDVCGAHGKCVNEMGFFYCDCDRGFTYNEDNRTCTDVDECLEGTVCVSGTCVNTKGSFRCHCHRGYRLQAANHTCQDIDECRELGGSICGAWLCENTPGSYSCVVSCPPGHSRGPQGACMDVDECAQNGELCGSYGSCENMPGSFRCLCDPGFQPTPDDHYCEDVNECELLSGACGEAHCENVDGSFLCVCPEHNQEFNHMTGKCSTIPPASSVERKECYYNMNSEKLCENVLSRDVTFEECCCTVGAGWGDNCEVRPCPIPDTDQFAQMCPGGKGSVPNGDVFGVNFAYKDADECALFGPEICRGGFCHNTDRSYECYCKSGFNYDEARLECVDRDECLDKSVCEDAECLNTPGSYMCFCAPPMVLIDGRCVYPIPAAEVSVPAADEDVCWRVVMSRVTCSQPMEKKTTYTECCCQYGEAWGMNCAFCPMKNTGDYATLCNLPVRPTGRPYGRDSLVAAPEDMYDYEDHPDYKPRPAEHGLQTLPLYKEEDDQYDAFEGFRAEECGILNGCENGRCVRVQEGYTCECFDGYSLDMSRMACVDVNECSELNSRMSLCKNGKCINTPGSYKCVCLPGFIHSERPNYCVPKHQAAHTP